MSTFALRATVDNFRVAARPEERGFVEDTTGRLAPM
jgi:hypothetical protein